MLVSLPLSLLPFFEELTARTNSSLSATSGKIADLSPARRQARASRIFGDVPTKI
jgi:hypothetical protein